MKIWFNSMEQFKTSRRLNVEGRQNEFSYNHFNCYWQIKIYIISTFMTLKGLLYFCTCTVCNCFSSFSTYSKKAAIYTHFIAVILGENLCTKKGRIPWMSLKVFNYFWNTLMQSIIHEYAQDRNMDKTWKAFIDYKWTWQYK